ncbi:hypothetical protein KA005_15585 [bacterium]|nr:hypothetical protein [bacterium]
MPFNDFEDELMIEIYKERDRKRSVLKNIKLSWLFFIIGMISGIALISVPSLLNETTADLTLYIATLSILMIALCLIILLFAEKLIRFSFFRER